MNLLSFLHRLPVTHLAAIGGLAPVVAVLGAGIICRCFPRASAAARHWIWQLAFAAMASCLAVTILNIKVTLPILPSAQRVSTHSGLLKAAGDVTAGERLESLAARQITRRVIDGAASWLLVVWPLGSLFLFLRFLVGTLRLRAMIRRSRSLDDDVWMLAGDTFSASRRSRARHVISSEIHVPLVTGIFRPVVILPEAAMQWPPDLVRTALFHEHAHLRRNDLFSSAFAHCVACLYWFNPAVWYALSRVHVEAEMAADDSVIVSAMEPIAYAEVLVELVRILRRGGNSISFAIGMLRGSGIQARVARVLDGECRRLAPRASVRWVAMSAAVLVTSGIVLIRLGTASPMPVRTNIVLASAKMPEAFEPAAFTLGTPYPPPANEPPQFRARKLIYYAESGRVLVSVSQPVVDGIRLDFPLGPVAIDYGTPVRTTAGRQNGRSNWNVDSPGPGYREQKSQPVRRRSSSPNADEGHS